MSKLTKIEKNHFLKLFNRGGYVLDFSTPDFDGFTLDSVGIALCKKYSLSKGKSLSSYLEQAPENDAIKLLADLLDYYEHNYQSEIEGSDEYAKIYQQCKVVINRYTGTDNPLAPYVDAALARFSSDYLSTQIKLMMEMQAKNPTEAIGKAKELVESCCKTILDDYGDSHNKSSDIGQLTRDTFMQLKLMPKGIPDTAPAAKELKAILGNLMSIATNLAAIRNIYGSGHGKSATFRGLEERHAKLAVGSSITLVSFLWDTHERRS